MKVAQNEIQISTLEQQLSVDRAEKEKLQKQQSELDLMPVRGSQGHCLRCEALVISNG